MNTFQKFPQFIDTDIRTSRYNHAGYNVNQQQMFERHQTLLPHELVNGRSVLDLGCCIASTGAWVLDHGAASYTGIELQHKFVNQAKQNLSTYFPTSEWHIIESSVEDFFKSNVKKYDLIYAGGVLYTSLYYQELLKNMADTATVSIIIESKTPAAIVVDQDLELWPIVEYNNLGLMIHENSANIKIRNAFPSIGAISILLDDLGFEFDIDTYNAHRLCDNIPRSRYGGVFYKKNHQIEKQTTENLYNSESDNLIPWNVPIPNQWEFNKDVANGFVQHARMHIPDYDKIIDLSVNLCKTILDDPLNARIIDVGCATGETISRLYNNGCCNLIGVDSSQAMLDRCVPEYAYYILNEKFPVDCGPYDAVLCNWTLHFVADKITYLTEIYNNLNPGGFIVLTDKTENSGIALELYHKFKRRRGVSDREIIEKAKSVQNIMFINTPDWYFRALDSIGFTKTSILSSAPCFTTFIAFK